jgi:phage N-6-adenine-methyltransferase
METSKTTEWSTPQDLFDQLNEEFRFTVDVAASAENAKCERFWTKEQNGLKQDWAYHHCWVNPPYGEPEQPCKPNCQKKRCAQRGYHVTEYVPGIIDWVRKADTFSARFGATVVLLLPARTDTVWFHQYIYNNPRAEIRFLRGRLKFGGCKDAAPFPSMIVVFRPAGKTERQAS